MSEIIKEYYELIGMVKEYINYQKMCGVDYCPSLPPERVNKELEQEIDMEDTLTQKLHHMERVEKPLPTTRNVGEKEERITALQKDLEGCAKCKLSENRTKIVFGEGDLNAQLVFVGEAPGRDEDASGRPFVGRAGQLLTKIIEAIGFKREDVYIMNIVKCRPPENRNPENDEIKSCESFMLRQLEIIKPNIICALGTFSAQTLLDTKVPISKLRGQFHDYHGIKLMPTYHPAYLLRNPNMKRDVWEDMKLVMAEYKT